MEKNSHEPLNFIGKSRILIAPLDWGLGHATRCIPIVYELLNQGHEVVIAADVSIKTLLQQEFPDIEYLHLKGYQIRYGKTRWRLVFNLLCQVPKFLKSVASEKAWLGQVIKKKQINIVISDNRFGLYNNQVHSVFITHQLLIKSPFLQRFLQKINYHFINKFDECWIPDFNEQPNLAGDLSHPKKLPLIPVKYIGWLSRFKKKAMVEPSHLLIILSGPEPQRSILESIITKQLEKFLEPVLVVRGLPGNESKLPVRNNVKFINHLSAGPLEDAIQASSFVIARSGYSTVMDLLKMEKKAILIPTPGQTEQEYLAQHLLKNKLAFCINQERFDLDNALKNASNFEYAHYKRDGTNLLQEVLGFDRFLSQ